MKNAVKITVIMALLLPAIGFSQNFTDEINALLSPSIKDFSTIKGDYVSNISPGSYQYKCTKTLSGFSTYILTRPDGKPMFYAASSGSSANLNALMLILLPPSGFGLRDSNSDASVVLKDKIKRMATFVSTDRRTILNILFYDDESINMSITKQFD